MKRKYVKLDECALKSFVVQRSVPTYTRIKEGIPETAALVNYGFMPCGTDPAGLGYVYLVFEDESFPELQEGVKPEPTPIIVQTIQSLEEL